jgi:hypothetical protein
MRGVITTVIVALLAVFVFAAPKPASALPAQAAIDLNNASQANSDLVEVKKRYKNKKYNKKYKNRYKRGRYYRGPRYGGRYYGRGYYGRRYYGRGYYGRRYYGRGYYGRRYGYGRRGAVTIWW